MRSTKDQFCGLFWWPTNSFGFISVPLNDVGFVQNLARHKQDVNDDGHAVNFVPALFDDLSHFGSSKIDLPFNPRLFH